MEGDSGLINGLSNSSSTTTPKMENLDMAKYWKNRILFAAVESIITSEIKLPGISEETVKYLEKMLIDVKFKRLGNSQEESSSPDPPHLTPKVKETLNKYINIEIESMAQSVVKIYLENSKGESRTNEADLLQEIVRNSVERNEEIKLNELEAETLIEVRDKELKAYQKELVELNTCLTSYIESTLKECPAVDAAYIELLKGEGESLVGKMRLASFNKSIDENPPGLVSDYSELCGQLDAVTKDLEDEIRLVDDLETHYNSLDPKFQNLLKEWDELEEEIKVKEFSLKSLEAFGNNSLDISTSDYV